MRSFIGLLAIPLLLACPGARQATSASEAAATPKYDGAWWQSVPERERSGFVEGAIDCYIGDYHGAPRFEASSLVSYRDRIASAYQAAPARSGESVLQMLLSVGDSSSGGARDSTSALHGHGFFDGLYWMGMHHGGPDEAVGFLEGYLSCYRHFLPDASRGFTRSPAEYRLLITKWYRFDETTGDVDAERQKAPIAEALRMVSQAPADSVR